MYLATGISVIPIQPGSKKAAIKWEPFQKRRMSAEESRQHFINGCQVAMVGGTISGNLECLDFDKPDLFQPFLDTVESVNPALRGKLTAWQNTPSGGFHVLFRCSGPVGGNQKLAMSARYKDDQGKLRQDVFIETRGEGGYFLVAPSKGYALHGSPQAPPVLTPEERDLLFHGIARSFDEAGQQAPQQPARTEHGNGERPGDGLNREADWRAFLEGEGWTYVKTVGDREHWTRPGKNDGSTSATLNDQGLFVFSTSTPLPAMKPLSKFAFYTHYRFGGDFTAAARELSRQGMEAGSQAAGVEPSASQKINPVQLLEAFAVSKEYAGRLGKEEFLIPNLLIKGHILVVVAQPGGGKTAFFFRHVAPLLSEKGCKVFYLDCDSPVSDHPQMLEIAERHGFRFLNPDANVGTSIDGLKNTLQQIADGDSDLDGFVFILDTLKKFANLMQKDDVKNFFKLCRKLTARGATVVLLAHANKYRSAEGHLIPEGTGDVRNDSDDLIIFERVKNANDGIDVTTVVDPDRNAKTRGIFHPFSFHISPEREITFYKFPLALGDPGQTAALKTTDEEILEAATAALEEMGGCAQQALVNRVCDLTGAVAKRTRELIVRNSERADLLQKEGRRFWFTVGAHNRYSYSLAAVTRPPEQVPMFEESSFAKL